MSYKTWDKTYNRDINGGYIKHVKLESIGNFLNNCESSQNLNNFCSNLCTNGFNNNYIGNSNGNVPRPNYSGNSSHHPVYAAF